MEVKVGEYVRTKQGDISKVECVEKEDIILEDDVWSKNDLYEKTSVLYFDDEEIVKHSKNIIDLIEEGDYVNTEKVIAVDNYGKRIDIGIDVIGKEDIKSIVTKEKFSNMEYRL